MRLSDWINLCLAILSLLLSIISVVTVVITLRQNKKMIESTSRPYVVIYGEITNFSNLMFYIVMKNYGKSGAKIKKLSCDVDLSRYSYSPSIVPFGHIENTMLAPNQNIICNLDFLQLNRDNVETLNFIIEYEFCGKTYTESFPVNYAVFRKNLVTKASTPNKELKTISYAIQELVQKNL